MLSRATWDAPNPELQTLLELGQGGMATAYLVRTLGVGGFERLVVLKRLSLELLDNPAALERFLTEARVAAKLHHFNIVGTHQIGRDAEGPFIVLDYIEGGSLEDLVLAGRARGENLPAPVVLRIALDALSGLRAVHEATDGSGRPLEILHRDVSLQNILVSVSDGASRISDFGVARSSLNRLRTDPGCFVGKVLYFPPEYLLGDSVGPTLDLYGLGVTLWLALTGEELWPGQETAALARSIVRQGVPSLAGRLAVAPEIRAFVARACARDPRERFQSAREMAEPIEHFDRGCGWVASYGDVAATVEHLLGQSLARRRERIAELAPGLVRARPAAPLAAPATPATTPTAPATPDAKRFGARHTVALAVALGVLSLLALSLGSARPPPSPALEVAPVDASAPRAQAASPSATTLAQEVALDPAPADERSRPPAAVQPAEAASESRLSAPRAPAHHAVGAPQASGSAAAPPERSSAGHELKRRNPYR